MRMRPPLYPSAALVGAAPRRDGRWVSVWRVGALVCATLGAMPGDAATARRSTAHRDAADAATAARRRLDDPWDAYLADRACPPGREVGGPGPRFPDAKLEVPAPANEGPVTPGSRP